MNSKPGWKRKRFGVEDCEKLYARIREIQADPSLRDSKGPALNGTHYLEVKGTQICPGRVERVAQWVEPAPLPIRLPLAALQRPKPKR